MKAALRGLAEGKEGFEKFPKLLKERFIMVNYWCTSVQAEHDPRGPDGPYQFKDRSVPLFIIKKWDGTELIHQLGFPSSGGDKAVARWVEKAVKENGPINPPKALKPLIKGLKKANDLMAKSKPGDAWKEATKVVKLGANERKFPEGPPRMAVEAQALIQTILTDATTSIEEALSEEDSAACLKALRKLASKYRAVPDLKKRINEEIKSRK